MNPSTQHDRLISDLMSQHQRQLLFFIFGICPNHDAAEDILQETNHVIWSKRAEFLVGSNFLAWARTIAKYQTLSYLKSRSNKSWLQFDTELVEELARGIENRALGREARKQMLRDCLQALDPKDRELVFKKYQRKLSHKAICAETGRSEGGIKQAFLRIRKILRDCVRRKELAADAVEYGDH